MTNWRENPWERARQNLALAGPVAEGFAPEGVDPTGSGRACSWPAALWKPLTRTKTARSLTKSLRRALTSGLQTGEPRRTKRSPTKNCARGLTAIYPPSGADLRAGRDSGRA